MNYAIEQKKQKQYSQNKGLKLKLAWKMHAFENLEVHSFYSEGYVTVLKAS